jgi:hypothetical protein
MMGTHASVNYSDVARSLVSDLWAQWRDDGDETAQRAIRSLAIDGARNRAQVRGAQAKSPVWSNLGSKIVMLKDRLPHRRRKPDGRAEKAVLQTLWTEMTWAEFEESVNMLLAQLNALGEHLTAARLILKLRDLYPDTKSPGEACERAGIDPHNFKLFAA